MCELSEIAYLFFVLGIHVFLRDFHVTGFSVVDDTLWSLWVGIRGGSYHCWLLTWRVIMMNTPKFRRWNTYLVRDENRVMDSKREGCEAAENRRY